MVVKLQEPILGLLKHQKKKQKRKKDMKKREKL